jgi:hypothetical protein
MLPFGIQSTQVHLNYMSEKKFNKFEYFIEKNKKSIITFDAAIEKVNNNLFSKCSRITLEKSLKLLRLV